MKKTIITIIASIVLIVFVNQAFAQVPQGFNYQAVARNSSGVLLSGANLGVLLTVHQGSAGGTIVYSERQTPMTNQFGLFTVTVGQGTQISAGAFNAIDWSSGNYWLEVGLDVSGGTSYTIMGNSQLLSVPYAMYSANSGASGPLGTSGQTLRHDGTNWVANSVLYNNGTKIGINTIAPQRDISIYGGSSFASLQFTSSTTTQGFYNGFSLGLNTTAGDAYIANHENQPISIATNSITRMIIAADGKIGIGTIPAYQLHVAAAAANRHTGYFDNSYACGSLGIGFDPLILGSAAIIGNYTSSGADDGTGVYGKSAPVAGYGYGGYFDGNWMGVVGRGAVGGYAGVYAYANGATNAIYINGNLSGTGTNNYTSDAKLKRNIRSINGVLDKIMQMRPSVYEFKVGEFGTMELPKGDHYGLVAQDLQKIYPELVIENTFGGKGREGSFDYLGINYQELTPILIKAIQEQQAIINDLQNQVNDLKALIITK